MAEGGKKQRAQGRDSVLFGKGKTRGLGVGQSRKRKREPRFISAPRIIRSLGSWADRVERKLIKREKEENRTSKKVLSEKGGKGGSPASRVSYVMYERVPCPPEISGAEGVGRRVLRGFRQRKRRGKSGVKGSIGGGKQWWGCKGTENGRAVKTKYVQERQPSITTRKVKEKGGFQ